MRIKLTKEADKFISKQDKPTRKRIIKGIEELREADYHESLVGYPLFKKRVGDYRIIYDQNGHILSIILVGNRGQMYRDLKNRFKQKR